MSSVSLLGSSDSECSLCVYWIIFIANCVPGYIKCCLWSTSSNPRGTTQCSGYVVYCPHLLHRTEMLILLALWDCPQLRRITSPRVVLPSLIGWCNDLKAQPPSLKVSDSDEMFLILGCTWHPLRPLLGQPCRSSLPSVRACLLYSHIAADTRTPVITRGRQLPPQSSSPWKLA